MTEKSFYTSLGAALLAMVSAAFYSGITDAPIPGSATGTVDQRNAILAAAVSVANSSPIRDAHGCIWAAYEELDGSLYFAQVANKDRNQPCANAGHLDSPKS